MRHCYGWWSSDGLDALHRVIGGDVATRSCFAKCVSRSSAYRVARLCEDVPCHCMDPMRSGRDDSLATHSLRTKTKGGSDRRGSVGGSRSPWVGVDAAPPRRPHTVTDRATFPTRKSHPQTLVHHRVIHTPTPRRPPPPSTSTRINTHATHTHHTPRTQTKNEVRHCQTTTQEPSNTMR